jgi:hypothetical protein
MPIQLVGSAGGRLWQAEVLRVAPAEPGVFEWITSVMGRLGSVGVATSLTTNAGCDGVW